MAALRSRSASGWGCPAVGAADRAAGQADAARALSTDEERAVVRELVLDEIVGGSATTAGELLDKLEKATPEQRRPRLRRARLRAEFRDDMYERLTADPEPAATKSVQLPVQVASFEC
jgi:hypothetical protein